MHDKRHLQFLTLHADRCRLSIFTTELALWHFNDDHVAAARFNPTNDPRDQLKHSADQTDPEKHRHRILLPSGLSKDANIAIRGAAAITTDGRQDGSMAYGNC